MALLIESGDMYCVVSRLHTVVRVVWRYVVASVWRTREGLLWVKIKSQIYAAEVLVAAY